MHISQGLLKGFKIPVPDRKGLRPTKSRVVEGILSALRNDIPEARCYDLFCGSGTMGMHFLSLGASAITFCDDDTVVIASLQKLKDELLRRIDQENTSTQPQIYFQCKNVDPELISHDAQIIWLDPPYTNQGSFYTNLLKELTSRAPHAIIAMEAPTPLCGSINTWIDQELVSKQAKIYKYGKSSVVLLKGRS